MERLTKQNYKFSTLNIMQGLNRYTEINEIMNRLAAYEDTGLEPGEIPHWIPVSERMPDPKDMKHIQVLVIQKSTITGRPNLMSVARWNGVDWICRGVELKRVTHWAYLPQPPKGEK